MKSQGLLLKYFTKVSNLFFLKHLNRYSSFYNIRFSKLDFRSFKEFNWTSVSTLHSDLVNLTFSPYRMDSDT